MRIAIQPQEFDETRKKLSALPAGCQSEVYGDGMYEAAKKSALKSRRLVLPRGKGLTVRGLPRRHLANSIKAIRVSWRFGGEKVPRSAAIVLAEQPHAHLIERGTVRWKKGPRPFLAPPLRDAATLMGAVRLGSAKSFRRLIDNMNEGRLTARQRKYFKVHVPGWS